MPTRTGEFNCWLTNRWSAKLQDIRRSIWLLSKGELLPDDITVGTTCQGRTCCRPGHLAIRLAARKQSR